MTKLLGAVLVMGAASLGSVHVAQAGGATDAALGLSAFAVFNQFIRGETVFHGFFPPAPVVVQQPVVVAPPPVVVVPPRPVVYVPRPAKVVYYYAPAPVRYAPAPVRYGPVRYGPAPVYYVPKRVPPAYYHAHHKKYAPHGRNHHRN